MHPDTTATSCKRTTLYPQPLLWIDLALTVTLLLLPNTLISLTLTRTGSSPHPHNLHALNTWFTSLPWDLAMLWLIASTTLGLVAILLRKYILRPLIGLAPELEHLLGELAPEQHSRPGLLQITASMRHIATTAHHHYTSHRAAKDALMQAQQTVVQISQLQQTLLSSASREMLNQYQSVRAYANYLEERIAKQSLNADICYDFDDVRESGFKLKLIAGALALLHQNPPALHHPVLIPELMQRTLLALSASLDRRCMKLTTHEVDPNVIALSDPAIVTHILWMTLLGTIRYAAEESTLRLRCLYNHNRSSVLISMTVSELSPGILTEQERSSFLLRQSCQPSPHLFAETIRIHANLQLSESLAARIGGELSILPLTSYSCEICLKLPANQ